jgi:hypothetical protein
VYPSADAMKNLEPTINLPADILQYREEIWTKLKGS